MKIEIYTCDPEHHTAKYLFEQQLSEVRSHALTEKITYVQSSCYDERAGKMITTLTAIVEILG